MILNEKDEFWKGLEDKKKVLDVDSTTVFAWKEADCIRQSLGQSTSGDSQTPLHGVKIETILNILTQPRATDADTLCFI